MMRFPTQHFSSAVLCNSSDTDPTRMVQKIADIYPAQEMTPAITSPTIELTAQQLSVMEGLYWNRDGDEFIKAYTKEDKIHVVDGGQDSVLRSIGEGRFHVADVSYGDQVTFAFEPGAQGKPRRLLESYQEEKPEVFESVQAFAPSAAELAEDVGEYVSGEIDPVYRIILQDGKLSVTRLKHKPTMLEPSVRDAFSSSLGTIRFTRDANQHISGFVINSGRIRNFRFTRRVE